MNSDLSDIGTALTGSLARDGQGGMTAILPLNTTGFGYTNDPNTGMYRTGSDAQAIKCGGSDIVSITTSGASVTGDLSASGVVKQNGFNLQPIGIISAYTGSVAPSGWVLAYGQSLSRTTYSLLWAFAQAEIALGNTLYTNGDGTTTFTVPDMRGNLPYGRDNMGGSAAGRLTSTYYTGNPSLIGSPGGSQSVTLTTAQLAQHSHTFTGQAVTYNIDQANIPYGTTGVGVSGPGPQGVPAIGAIGQITATVTPFGSNSNTGSNSPHSNLPPGLITTYIIFAGA